MNFSHKWYLEYISLVIKENIIKNRQNMSLKHTRTFTVHVSKHIKYIYIHIYVGELGLSIQVEDFCNDG